MKSPALASEMSRLCIRHMLSRPVECKTPVRRARYCGLFAAVGILKMPSGALSRENRGRRRTFYISTGRAQRNASPPLLRNALPRHQEMPRLRRNYSRPNAFLMTSTESRSSHPKNWTFSRVFLPWMFISTLARYGLRPTWP